MPRHLLILGGTTEARALAEAVAARDIPATLSLAGRVKDPRPLPLPTRIGGFGGAQGLAGYVREKAVTALIDATHPFAARMSHNSAAAARATGIPLAALTRAPWQPQPGDDWTSASDVDAAVASLQGPPQRVFLALGRQNIAAFAAQPQHHYLLRLVDPPDIPPPLRDHHVVLDRGPFDEASDRALLRTHRITRILCKNSGGAGARAKLDAACALGLPVTMIDRPALPVRPEFTDISDILAWIGHP